MAMITFRINRFNPDDERRGHYVQEYQLECQKGMTLLDALNEIKWKQDGTLTFRRSCRSGSTLDRDFRHAASAFLVSILLTMLGEQPARLATSSSVRLRWRRHRLSRSPTCCVCIAVSPGSRSRRRARIRRRIAVRSKGSGTHPDSARRSGRRRRDRASRS